jgi:hypothetical protein
LAIFIGSRVPVPENDLAWFVGPAMCSMVLLLVVPVRNLHEMALLFLFFSSSKIGIDTAKTMNSLSLSLSIGCSHAYLAWIL